MAHTPRGKEQRKDAHAHKPVNPSGTAASKKKNAGSGTRHRPMRTVEFTKVKVTQAPRIQNMRRPKPRRRAAQVTAEFGKVRPRSVRRKTGVSAIRDSAKQSVQTVKVRGARLPWPMIVTAVCCTAVIMALVINCVRLNELSNNYGSLKREIVSLSSDKKTLTLALEQKNDLIEIDKKAEESGMVKSNRVEKRYINLTGEDKIEVPETEDGAISRFFTTVKNGLTEIIRNIFG